MGAAHAVGSEEVLAGEQVHVCQSPGHGLEGPVPPVAVTAYESVADVAEVLREDLAGRVVEVFEHAVRFGGIGLHPGGDGCFQVEGVGRVELSGGEVEVGGPELEPGMVEGRLMEVDGDEAGVGDEAQAAEVLLEEEGDGGACAVRKGLEAGTEVGAGVEEGFAEAACFAQEDRPGWEGHGAQDAPCGIVLGGDL